MSINRTIICFVFMLLMSKCLSQEYLYLETYNVDSLLLALPAQDGKDRINTLNMLSISLCYKEFIRSEQYALEAMSLAKELDYHEGIADSYRNFGHLAFYRSNYPDALNYYLESLQIYEKLNNKYIVARIYLDIAKTHLLAGNSEKAIEYSNIALNRFHEPLEGGGTVGSVRDTTMLILGMASTYLDLGMVDQALEMYHKVLDLGKTNNFGNIEMMLTALLVANCYFWTGETDSAKVYWDKALAYPENTPSLKAMRYHTITSQADLLYAEGKIDSAILHKQVAFEWFSESGFLYWAMFEANRLGDIYFEDNDVALAETYFRQSEELFIEMLNKNSWYRYDSLKYVVTYGTELYFPMPENQIKEKMWELGRWMYYSLYQFYEASERTEDALKYFIEYHNANDTLSDIKRYRESMEIMTKYESERKDQQIETLSLENELKESRLNQNRYFLFGSAGLFFAIIMLAYILFRQNKLKSNQQMLILQQKLLRSQMNPHFIFNSLSSIQGYIMERNPKTASKYLARFATLVRNILDSSAEELVPLDKEINTIENYLELQKARYEGKFEYVIEVDESIESNTTNIPPMLAQPFIENSIEHGFKHKEGKGIIKVRIGSKNSILRIEVEDDGVGREKAIEIQLKQNKDHRSMATDITRERLKILNKKFKKKITLEIIDLKNEAGSGIGTKVVFEIPLSIA